MGQSSSQETFICFSSPILLCLSVCRSRDILCRAESFCLILESSVWTQEKRRRKQSKPRINNCSYGRQAGVRRKRGLTVCRHSGRTGLQRAPCAPTEMGGNGGHTACSCHALCRDTPRETARQVGCCAEAGALQPKQGGPFSTKWFFFCKFVPIPPGICCHWRLMFGLKELHPHTLWKFECTAMSFSSRRLKWVRANASLWVIFSHLHSFCFPFHSLFGASLIFQL